MDDLHHLSASVCTILQQSRRFTQRFFLKNSRSRLTLLLFCLMGVWAQAAPNDVTSKITVVGNPFLARYGSISSAYTRNVWDMQRDNGKIYLGHGDYNANSGPTDIWVYDPQANQFSISSTIQQEQIDHFKYLNGHLAIPGTDPRGSGTEGYYTLENGNWITHTITVPFTHCFDVDSSGSLFMAAVGTAAMNNDALDFSTNSGTSWTKLSLLSGEPTALNIYVSRMFTTFVWQGALYGSGWVLYELPDGHGGSTFPRGHLIRFDSPNHGQLLNVATCKAMLPGISNADPYFMYRPVHFGSHLVYLSATSDDMWQPKSLCVADSIGSARAVSLTGNAVPYDIVVGDDGVCYVLGVIKTSNTQYTLTVNASTDLTVWTELFRFQTATYARSFEYLNGCFYFGLGCSTTALSADSGKILKYQYIVTPPVHIPVLTVISDHGTPLPAKGDHSYTSGTLVSATIGNSPELDAAGTTRWLCSGWTGTGAVAASGTTTQTSFAIDRDTSITWLWKTQYQLAATASPPTAGAVTLNDGVTSANGSWHDAAALVAVKAVPAAGYVFAGWSGDASGNNTTFNLILDRPRQVTATFLQQPPVIVQPILTVISDHGTPLPAKGDHSYTSGTLVSATVGNSPELDTAGTTRWLCSGWSGTGAVAASGTTTQTSFNIDRDTSITWLWKTQYQLAATASPATAGAVTLSDGVTPANGSWHDAAALVAVKAVPAAGYVFAGWSGDASGNNTTFNLTLDRPRQVTATFLQRPQVIDQPTSQTVDLNADVSFRVTAAGSPPLAFQWRKNDQPMNGETSSTLRLATVGKSAEGDYNCLVTNAAGNVLSDHARLRVLAPATLVASPSALRFDVASKLSVNVEHDGLPTTQSLTLRNTGDKTASFSGGVSETPGLRLSGRCACDFQIDRVNPPTTTTLAPGSSLMVTIKFVPTETSRALGLDAALEITTDSPLTPKLTIPILGDAVPVTISSFSAD